MNVAPPRSRDELLERAWQLAGKDIGELADQHLQPIPDTRRAKGWQGQFIERLLGASGGADAVHDFPALRIELKTVPVSPQGMPLESTFVCTASDAAVAVPAWHDSWVYQKLAHVLWIPIVRDESQQRTVGAPLLWEMDADSDRQLAADWYELSEMLQLGQYAELGARHGTWLQVRPKAANAREQTLALDEHGDRLAINPRGFYLRTTFTRRVFAAAFLPA